MSIVMTIEECPSRSFNDPGRQFEPSVDFPIIDAPGRIEMPEPVMPVDLAFSTDYDLPLSSTLALPSLSNTATVTPAATCTGHHDVVQRFDAAAAIGKDQVQRSLWAC